MQIKGRMIKLFLVDVDATLTDGNYLVAEDGSLSKNFFSRDFHGMYLLNEVGVEVAIITTSRDHVIKRQCSRSAEYITILTDVHDKLSTVTKLIRPVGKEKLIRPNLLWDEGFLWDEVSYIGDDVIDLHLLDMVGLAACPANAHDAVKSLIYERKDGIVLSKNGGCGCVREFADMVLSLNSEKENE